MRANSIALREWPRPRRSLRSRRRFPAITRAQEIRFRSRGAVSSRPAIAGRGDRPKGGGRGAGNNESLSTKVERRVRRPLHHPALASQAPDGPPPPLSRGRKKIQSRSRGAVFDSHPSYEHAKKLRRKSRPSSDRSGSGGPDPSRSGAARKNGKERKERKQNAERRNPTSALARCGARPAGRARLPAFHCGSRQGDYSSPRLSTGHAS